MVLLAGGYDTDGVVWIRSEKDPRWNWTGRFRGTVADGDAFARLKAKQFGKTLGIPSPGDIEIGCHKYVAQDVPDEELPALADKCKENIK